jgi:hypothetical protein
VNRDTGEFTLSNSAASIDVVGINIQSASGALDPTKWKSVTDNYDSDNGASFDLNNTWLATTSTANQLLEVEQSGNGGQLGTGGTQTSLQLGNPDAWLLSRYEDLVVSIDRLLPGAIVETIGVPVTYVGGIGAAAARSDLNFDGDITGADWSIFAANHAKTFTGTIAQAAAQGDLDGNLTNDYDDFVIFEADFDAANGAGALAAVISGVPEPSTAALMLIYGCATLRSRRKYGDQDK